jgi:hypothetical protein
MELGCEVEAFARGRGRDARQRLDWLVGLCLLPARAEKLLTVLIGLSEDEPTFAWWSTAALAARLGCDETVVTDELAPTAPLMQWGLVKLERRAGHAQVSTRVAVNLRIARFLIG